MRETKHQKIARLSRKVLELESKLKEMRKQSKVVQKESNYDIVEIEKKHKLEILELRKEIKQLQLQHEEEKRTLVSELEQTKELVIFWRNRTEEYQEKEDMKSRSVFEEDTKLHNDIRLEYFNGGLYCDKYQYHFFDRDNLIFTKNPYTGGTLDSDAIKLIKRLIQNETYYIQRLTEIQTKLQESDFDSDLDLQLKIYDLGMEIYKNLYSDFPFNKFEM